jgi:hypothetical protein
MDADDLTQHLHRHAGLKAASERSAGPTVQKVVTMELFNFVKPLVESFFSSTVNVQPGLLVLLFFVGLMLGWFFGH